MKTSHFFCLFLICTQPVVQGKSKAVLSMITTGWDLISMGIDIGKLIMESVDEDLSDKVDGLERAINDFKNYVTIQISMLRDLIREEIFVNYVRGLLNDVDSCLQEYEHLKVNLHATGMKDNFWNQCKDIINPLRALREILIGESVIGKSSLMTHLNEKEGFCNGVTMGATFSYIFGGFAEGCAAFSIAQTFKHGNLSRIYEEEFRRAFDDIKTYMTKVFQECSIQICSRDFQPKLNEILKINKTLNGTIIQFHQQLPYLKFLILKKRSDTPAFPRPANHILQNMELQYNGHIYRIYALKSHEVSNGTGPLYKLIEYYPSDILDYEFSDDMKVGGNCVEGMSICAFTIYVNRKDAGCFQMHGTDKGSTANASPLVFILSISIGILSYI
ncbi:uncharacterized protein LOC130052691 [Ostrea edulis]|uniref:uncharacterized protein LOC130052691 n=1 Tax=Ostrea edulis TaxID=37623 RepID=UPI0024AF9944|nr:uncharacterized protein LOC130052691 [Ostrea edulis]XP_056014382.1 uncharacterized protein LOC130052691 [Ostrea edulis]